MTLKTLWDHSEIILPVAWSRNGDSRDVEVTGSPSYVKLHIIIHDRGRYMFGIKQSFYDSILGFTINVNGYDAKVYYPVNPTDEEIIDVTDLFHTGKNTVYVFIWRSAVNLVADMYVDFTIKVETDVTEENITITERPIEPESTWMLGGINLSSLFAFITALLNLIIMFAIIWVLKKLFD